MTYRRNDFQSKPKQFRGSPTMGVYRYPGFHTAASMVTTFAYAQIKAIGHEADVSDPFVDDYPVIVELDMNGLAQLPDYDAIDLAYPVIVFLAKQVIRESEESGKSAIDILYEYAEFGEQQELPPIEETIQLLFTVGASAVNDPIHALLNVAREKPNPDDFILRASKKKMTDAELMEVVGQYRYDQDVSSERIIKVYYLKPWWPEFIDWEEDEDEVAEELESIGWIVLGTDDAYSNDERAEEFLVWNRKTPKSSRLEYHGTSYKNLLSAASHLKQELPEPPSPYRDRGDEEI